MANEPNSSPKSATPKPWQWIINNTPRGLGFVRRPVWSEQAKSSTPDSDPLSLKPGANLVSVKRWEQLKAEDPDREVDGEPVKGEIARLIATKIPRADHQNRRQEKEGQPHLVEGPKVASNKAPLDGITEAEAVAIADELRDANLIRDLIKIEKRPLVSVALNRALALYMTGYAKAS